MEINLNNQQKKILNKGLNIKLALTANENMDVNMFTFAQYENDGTFNIMKLPKDTTLYHGSWSLVDNLIYMPFGRNFEENLRNEPPIAYIGNKAEKFWEELGNKGYIQPAWLSFLDIAKLYNLQKPIGMERSPNTCSYPKTVNIFGTDVEATSCILALKALKTNKIVLLEDVFNIVKIIYIIKTLTPDDWEKITENLTRLGINNNPGYMVVNNEGSLTRALELVLWGPIDRNDGQLPNGIDGISYEGQYEPRVKFSDIYPKQEEGDGKNRFGRDLFWEGKTNFSRASDTNIKIPFNRTSYHYYDIPCAYVLCWIINNKTPNKYDGMGNTFSKRIVHDPTQDPIWPPEIFFCNPFGSLIRDYENPIDWQYQEYLTLPPKLRDYFINVDKKVIKDYKSFKGDLLDITTWSALITEKLMVPVWKKEFQNQIREEFTIDKNSIKYFNRILIPEQITDSSIFIGIISSFFLSNILQYYCNNLCELYSTDSQDLWFDIIPLGTIISINPGIINEIIEGLTDVRLKTSIKSIPENILVNDINLIIFMATKILSGYSNSNFENILQELLNIFTLFSYSLNDNKTDMTSENKIYIFITTFNMASLVAFSFVLQSMGPRLVKNELTNYKSIIFKFLINRSSKYPGRTDVLNNSIIKKFIKYQTILYDKIDEFASRSTKLFIDFERSDIFEYTLDHPNIFSETLFNLYDEFLLNSVIVDWDFSTLLDIYYKSGLSQENLMGFGESAKSKNLPDDGENYMKLLIFSEILESKLRQAFTQVYRTPTVLQNQLIKLDLPDSINNFLKTEIGNISFELSQALIFYSPLFEKVNLEMNKYLYEIPDLEKLSGSDQEQLLVTLNITKNIYSIVCNNYGMVGYPLLISNPPRFNHNILNWLRSLWFVNKFLLESSVIANNSLNNKDIILIQLGTFLMSSGRVNESAQEIRLPYSIIKRIFDIDVSITGDKDTYINVHLLRLISACIAKDILYYIDGTNGYLSQSSKYYKYLILSLIIPPGNPNFTNFPEDFQEFSKIISIGHYLDHCRPTTGFSQLDTEVEGLTNQADPKGAKWLEEILSKYKLTRTWSETKTKYLQYQREILERSGFNIYQYDLDKNSETDYTDQYRCKKLWDRSDPVSQKFIDLSTNFEDAWSTIVMKI